MISVKLTSIMVNDQTRARAFYTEKLGFRIKHDIPAGPYNWLTLVAPNAPDGVELLLEPTGMDFAEDFQKKLYASNVPQTQLYTDDIRVDHARLKAAGVDCKSEPVAMGPTFYFDFDDTCGNLIRLVQG